MEPPHEAICPYRTVQCPDLKCNSLISLNSLLEHIKLEHKFALWLGKLDENSVARQYWNIKSDKNFQSDASNTWVLTIWSFEGNSYVAVFMRASGLWYSWVYILSHFREAAKYVYEIRITNPERKSSNYYVSVTHPIDDKAKDVMESHNCFVMTDETVKQYMTKSGLSEERIKEGYDYTLPIEYKIRKMTKREANM